MHLVESYAATSGLQISKPFIFTSYFPLPYEKYVVLHSGAGSNARLYDYYDEVIGIILPILKQYGYVVMQLGTKADPFVKGTVDFRGVTNLHQTAYAISGAALFIGADSCNAHIASSFDIPIVALFGPVYPETSKPYFSSPEKVACLMGDLKGNHPSYSFEEPEKVINSIKPELVAQKALDLLGIDHKVTRETICFGTQYKATQIDLVPNSVLAPQAFGRILPTIRMDYLFNEEVAGRNLAGRPCRIITQKPLSAQFLTEFGKRIHTVVYDITEDYSPEFVELMQRSGIRYIMTSLLSGEQLAQAKMDFFDFGIIIERRWKGKDVLEKYPQITKDTKYRTNRFLLADDKIYLNKYRWEQGASVESFDQNVDTVELNEQFFNYAENYYIFND